MEEIRRYHNYEKRRLIEQVTRPGDSVLDVGCGFGGDLQKWRHVRANLSMCEPDAESTSGGEESSKGTQVQSELLSR
jgi:ubiquinone/menaquinone biosynthesis C-methylase UbiE